MQIEVKTIERKSSRATYVRNHSTAILGEHYEGSIKIEPMVLDCTVGKSRNSIRVMELNSGPSRGLYSVLRTGWYAIHASAETMLFIDGEGKTLSQWAATGA